MRKDRFIAFILIGLMAALFAFVGVQMFKVRAEVNGVYPEYSSFRADPKGYRILFETLSRLELIHVERFEQPLNELPSGAGKILVLAGVSPNELSTDQTKLLDDWMAKGGTMLIAFSSLSASSLGDEGETQADPRQPEKKPVRNEVDRKSVV